MQKQQMNSYKMACKKNNSYAHKSTQQSRTYRTIVDKQHHKENITVDIGEKMLFSNPWNVWIHKNSSTDWSLDSYHKLMTINSVSDMWSFLNNFDKINYMEYQFFIMKNDITPVWEDPENINGGAASMLIRVCDPNLLKLWKDLCVLVINEQIYDNPKEINGISFNLKNDLTVIKIWNKDLNDDISNKLPECLINKYNLFAITYRKNKTRI